MPRPTKLRRVHNLPEVNLFKPAGVPASVLGEVTLAIEELEALRLKDLEGLDQEECADKMQVSRPTFQRILGAARQKVAKALVDGLAIRIEGGSYRMAMRKFQCSECGQIVELHWGRGRGHCPRCSQELALEDQVEFEGHRGPRQRRQGGPPGRQQHR